MITIQDLIEEARRIGDVVGYHQPVLVNFGELDGLRMRNNGAMLEVVLPKEIAQAQRDRDAAKDELGELEDDLAEIKEAVQDLLCKLGDGTEDTEAEIRALNALI